MEKYYDTIKGLTQVENYSTPLPMPQNSSYFDNLQTCHEQTKMIIPLDIKKINKLKYKIDYNSIKTVFNGANIFNVYICAKKCVQIVSIKSILGYNGGVDIIANIDMDLIYSINSLDIIKLIINETDDDIMFKLPFTILNLKHKDCKYLEIELDEKNSNDELSFYVELTNSNHRYPALGSLIKQNSYGLYNTYAQTYEVSKEKIGEVHNIKIPLRRNAYCIIIKCFPQDNSSSVNLTGCLSHGNKLIYLVDETIQKLLFLKHDIDQEKNKNIYFIPFALTYSYKSHANIFFSAGLRPEHNSLMDSGFNLLNDDDINFKFNINDIDQSVFIKIWILERQ
jgi:hypothetical protein